MHGTISHSATSLRLASGFIAHTLALPSVRGRRHHPIRVRRCAAIGLSVVSLLLTPSQRVLVQSPRVASIAITGVPSLTASSPSTQLAATVALSDGTNLNVTNVAAWRSANPDRATVSNTGFVAAVSTGTTRITATYEGKVASLVVSAGATATTLTSCQNISAPGRYSLTGDISGKNLLQSFGCLQVLASNVDLERNGHRISSPDQLVVFVNQMPQNFVMNNCVLSGYAEVDGTNALLEHNQLTEIVMSGGRNNTVTQNQITEGWPGPCRTLCDDGILMFDETNDVIQNNFISGMFDAGIESVYGVTNTVFANNVITNVGVTGIGSWWCTKWTGNMVAGNSVTNSPGFGLFRFDLLGDCGGRTPVFQNNVFEGKVLSNAAPSQTPVISISFPSTLPGPVVVGNNLLFNNKFGTAGGAPSWCRLVRSIAVPSARRSARSTRRRMARPA